MSYSDAELAAAITASHSWRGVLRHLGLSPTSAGSLRSARRRADRCAISYSHFTGQRRWSDSDLVVAVSRSRSWTEVARRLGVSDSSRAVTTARGHARRLELDTTHLERAEPHAPSDFAGTPQPDLLRRAAPALAAGWFQLRGYNVSVPLEPARYDLLVESGGRVLRVQVKTTVAQASTRGFVSLSNSRRVGKQTYGPDEIDYFFVLDERLDAYLIPVACVAGRYTISLARHQALRVAVAGQWLTAVSEVSSPEP